MSVPFIQARDPLTPLIQQAFSGVGASFGEGVAKRQRASALDQILKDATDEQGRVDNQQVFQGIAGNSLLGFDDAINFRKQAGEEEKFKLQTQQKENEKIQENQAAQVAGKVFNNPELSPQEKIELINNVPNLGSGVRTQLVSSVNQQLKRESDVDVAGSVEEARLIAKSREKIREEADSAVEQQFANQLFDDAIENNDLGVFSQANLSDLFLSFENPLAQKLGNAIKTQDQQKIETASLAYIKQLKQSFGANVSNREMIEFLNRLPTIGTDPEVQRVAVETLKAITAPKIMFDELIQGFEDEGHSTKKAMSLARKEMKRRVENLTNINQGIRDEQAAIEKEIKRIEGLSDGV